MLLQFWPWQNFRQVHHLLLFQMSAPVLVTGMMARLTLQGVTGRSIMSSAVLTRFLEGCSGSRRGGGIRRWDLPSLGSPRRHLLLRLETWKAFHLSPLSEFSNACACLPTSHKFTNLLLIPTTRSPTPPPLFSCNPEDSLRTQWQ